jgi:hypothetical protein
VITCVPGDYVCRCWIEWKWVSETSPESIFMVCYICAKKCLCGSTIKQMTSWHILLLDFWLQIYIYKFVPTNLYHSPQHMLPTKTSTAPNTVLIILILLILHCKLSLLSETTVAPSTLQYSLLLDALALHSPLSCRSAFQLLNIGTRGFDTRIFLQPVAELLVWHSHNPKNSCSDCSSTAITCTSRCTHMSTHRKG